MTCQKTAAKEMKKIKHFGNGDYFAIIHDSSSHPLLFFFFIFNMYMLYLTIKTIKSSFIVDRARCKWSSRSAVKVNIEKERFTVMCSRCR